MIRNFYKSLIQKSLFLQFFLAIKGCNMIRWKIVVRILSRIVILLSLTLFVNIIVAITFYESIIPFLIPALFLLVAGSVGIIVSKTTEEDIQINKKEAYLTVTFSWFLMGLIGSMPYLFSNTIPSFCNAYFESVSGYTTTGASILEDIEVLPKSILFWRSFTHWIGGIGIIVLVIIILPAFKISNYHLFSLESSLQEKIQPRIKDVGLRILGIYVSLTIAEIILLKLGKMNLFESICHAFATISTGGFSPKNTSIAGYSPYIQYVVMVFMLLSAVNFVFYYYLIKRKFSKIKSNEELLLFLILVLIACFIVFLILFFKTEKSMELAFREGCFQIISIISCTGFATTDYLLWPQFGWLLLFILMFMGGCTGSTSGGIKIARHLIVLKNIKRTFLQSLNPKAVLPIRFNKKILSNETNNAILSFVTIYIFIFIISAMILVFIGNDFITSCSSSATCMAGIGPGMGLVGPVSNYSQLNDLSKFLLTFLMIVGRLEIFTVMILFSKSFWKK